MPVSAAIERPSAPASMVQVQDTQLRVPGATFEITVLFLVEKCGGILMVIL